MSPTFIFSSSDKNSTISNFSLFPKTKSTKSFSSKFSFSVCATQPVISVFIDGFICLALRRRYNASLSDLWVTEQEFKDRGVNVVIYANQLTRTGFPAMQDAARTILENHRAKECDDKCMSIKEIITLIPEE